MKLTERLHAWHRIWRVRLRADRDELRYVLRRKLRGSTVVDIGANRGVYSYWLHRKVGPTGRVIAFEPQPELCDYLRSLRHAFSLNNLQIHKRAVSSSVGEAAFARPTGHWGGGSLIPPPVDHVETINVSLTTVDDFFEHHHALRPVRFVKCDVEGHELQVFQGAKAILQQDRPELLFEAYHDKIVQGDLTELLAQHDYVGYFFHRHRLIPIEAFSKLMTELALPFQNYLFAPREASSHLPVADEASLHYGDHPACRAA